MEAPLLGSDDAHQAPQDARRRWRKAAGLLVACGVASLCCTWKQPHTVRGLFLPEVAAPLFKDWKCGDQEWEVFLQKFGLDDHGKGFVMPWSSFRDHEPCAERNVLWLWPRYDHNGAFFMDSRACYRLMHWYPRACSVTVVNTSTVQEAQRVLHTFPDRSLMLADLGGHGDPNSLVWGSYSSVPDGTACVATQATPVYSLDAPDSIVGRLRTGQAVFSSGSLRAVGGVFLQPLQSGGMAQVKLLSCGIYTLDVAPASVSFLDVLRTKMYRDGSVVLDSCSTGAPNPNGHSNLVQFVADHLGDGIRVFAAVEALDTTDIKNFDAYYPLFNGKDPLVLEHGARCPGWAAAARPDGDDDCSCPAATECVALIAVPNTSCVVTRRTQLLESFSSASALRSIPVGTSILAAGQPRVERGQFLLPVLPAGVVDVSHVRCPTSGPCPRSSGLWSRSKFLPSCGDAWSRIQCGCV